MKRKLQVLVVGSGGREHALVWLLARSPRVKRVYAAPGNAGTAGVGVNVPLQSDDIAALLSFATGREIDLTVVGPETPLAAGIVDAFRAAGLSIFGPTQAAAQLEASKAFAKEFMQAQGIPTAVYGSFTDIEAARRYVGQLAGQDSGGVVVKASGLAAGKGVIVCESAAEAEEALHRLMVARDFGRAGDEVVIEERLSGPELSLMAFADGRTVIPMLPARDHKRVYDGDEGPNTGGMGAYTPLPDVSPAMVDEITQAVLRPAIEGMARRGTPYVGVLYAGLMLTATGPKMLEFNCRFGDPETQVVLPLLDGDLLEILLACTEERLRQEMVRFRRGACATVVMAAPGYPGLYARGAPVRGIEEAARLPDVLVFHAGTRQAGGELLTNGGRVLSVSGVGPDVAAAVQRAYSGVERISFDGAHYRRDIGLR